MSEGERWDQRYRDAPWPTDPDPDVVELVADLAPGRALDVGCGTGRHAVWLASRGWQVTGVDASAVGLAQAAQAAAAAGVQLRLVRAELGVDPLPEGPFDLVLLANIHPQPQQREAVFAACAAAVAPGGHLVAVGHHLDGLGSGTGGPPDAARRWTEGLLASAFPGLQVELAQRREWPRTAAGAPVVVRAVLRARRPSA